MGYSMSLFVANIAHIIMWLEKKKFENINIVVEREVGINLQEEDEEE